MFEAVDGRPIFSSLNELKGSFVMGERLYDVIQLPELRHKLEANNCRAFRSIVKQALQALVVLHKNKFVHCDLKSENILLTNDCQLKMIDFRSALHVSELAAKLVVTTPEYLSPEALYYLENPTDPAAM